MMFDKLADPLERTELSRDDESRRQDSLEQLTDALIKSADAARGTPIDQSYVEEFG